MSLDLEISPAVRLARTEATLATMDAGLAHCRLYVYATLWPGFAEPAGGPALVVIELAKPSGTIDLDGWIILTAAAPDGSMIDLDGEARWARLVAGDGSIVFDSAVSDALGLARIKLSRTTLYAGGYVRLLPSRIR